MLQPHTRWIRTNCRHHSSGRTSHPFWRQESHLRLPSREGLGQNFWSLVLTRLSGRYKPHRPLVCGSEWVGGDRPSCESCLVAGHPLSLVSGCEGTAPGGLPVGHLGCAVWGGVWQGSPAAGTWSLKCLETSFFVTEDRQIQHRQVSVFLLYFSCGHQVAIWSLRSLTAPKPLLGWVPGSHLWARGCWVA